MTAPPSTVALLDLAVTVAKEAGRTIAAMRHEAVSSHETKSSPTDPVTAADRAAEAVIVDGILAARPDDGILGEEGTMRPGRSGIEWFVDPIDGTTNYLYDLPPYVVSVAAVVDGRPVAAAVFDPSSEELFAARVGGGATRNGHPVAPTEATDLGHALVATGFAYQADRRRAQAETVARLLPEVRDIRRLGSAAYDLCAVASGRVDAYYEAGLNAWDYAAGWLIAAEAGARCTDLDGGPPSSQFLVAAAPGVHQLLIDALKGTVL